MKGVCCLYRMSDTTLLCIPHEKGDLIIHIFHPLFSKESVTDIESIKE